MSQNDPIPQLGRRTARGVLWLMTSRLLGRGSDFVTLLVLAAILGPADFGIVALAMTLIYIVEAILDLPLSQAMVRLAKITDKHLDTAFTIALLRGTVLATVVAALAWPFAFFYHEPRLLLLIIALSSAPVARGLQSPAMARYAQQIDFRRDFFTEIAGKLSALVLSVTVALATRSYWAIAVSTIGNAVFLSAISYILAPYRPRLTLVHWRDFAGFLGWSTGGQVLSALNWQLDRLVLGRLVAPNAVGAYAMASDLAAVPEQSLVKPVVRPLMASFAVIRADTGRLRESYLRTSAMLLALATPVLLNVSMLAFPIIRVMLGGKWLVAAPLLQWIALSSIAASSVALLPSLAMALGRTNIFVKQNGAELAFKLAIMWPSAVIAGVFGAAYARLGIAIIVTVIAMYFVRSLIGAGIAAQLVNHRRTIGAALIMAAILYIMQPLLSGLNGAMLAFGLACVAGLSLLFYAAVLAVLWCLQGRPAGLEAMVFQKMMDMRQLSVKAGPAKE